MGKAPTSTSVTRVSVRPGNAHAQRAVAQRGVPFIMEPGKMVGNGSAVGTVAIHGARSLFPRIARGERHHDGAAWRDGDPVGRCPAVRSP